MPRILVVDDDPDFVEIIRTILLTESYEVDTAANGDQALTKVRAGKPDLIILDIMMSTILDGVSVSQELHKDPELREIPLIMVSSIASTEHAQVFPTDEYLHVDRWLSKPVQPQDLLAAVKRFVS
ncbi:MAG: response regulator [Anaerolineae bacterium]|nr:response regulator [Anaerolineae bacterium]